MTADDFRRIALAFPAVVEGSHMGTTDFRTPKGIFATLGHPDACHGMVRLAPQQQEMLLAAEPLKFEPVKGGWGQGGATLRYQEILSCTAISRTVLVNPEASWQTSQISAK